MQVPDLHRLLDAALHKAQNRISLTVTDLRGGERHLRNLLESAFGAGVRNGLPLSEIQLSLERFPSLRGRFWSAPITDSGHPDVLRLIYDPARGAASKY